MNYFHNVSTNANLLQWILQGDILILTCQRTREQGFSSVNADQATVAAQNWNRISGKSSKKPENAPRNQ